MLIGLANCSSGERPCPTTVLELRPFEGNPVMGTQTTCDPPGSIAFCGDGTAEAPVTRTFERRCEGARIGILGQGTPLFSVLVFEFEDTVELFRVRAAREFGCGRAGCDVDVEQAVGGWIMIERHDARAAGRFHVEFPGFAIDGDYDSTLSPPVIDAAAVDGAAYDAGPPDATAAADSDP